MALEAALETWVLAQLQAQPVSAGTPRREQRRVLALDGQTLRSAHVRVDDSAGSGADDGADSAGDSGAGTGGGVHRPHLVSVLEQASGVVLGQVQVSAKGSEVAAFTTLLDSLELSDVLVTADALHTHRGHASTCTAAAGTT